MPTRVYWKYKPQTASTVQGDNCATVTVDTVVLGKFQAAVFLRPLQNLLLSCYAVLRLERNVKEGIVVVLQPAASNTAAL